MGFIVVVVIIAAVVFFIIKRNKTQTTAAFGNEGDESLLGTWGNDDATLVLKEGTGNWYNDTLTWGTQNNLFLCNWQGVLYKYEYKISGSTLTLVDVGGNDSGNEYIYTKRG